MNNYRRTILILFIFVCISLAFETAPLQLKTIDAWFVSWDVKNSLNILKNSPGLLNGINLFFYSLDKDGNIINTSSDPEEYKQIISFIRKQNIKLIPTITNDIVYSKANTVLKDPGIINRMLADPLLRKRHIEQILGIIEELDADGVDIDYEMLFPEDRDRFSSFIKDLSIVLHEQNKKLSVTVQQKTENHQRRGAGAIDWEEISHYADQIIIMCYNYSSRTSDPGPIGPLYWLKEIILFAKVQIPPEKICIALGLYGYDWSEKETSSVNLKKVESLVKEYSAQLEWDRKNQSPYFTYSKSGSRHEVWFENQQSIFKKIQLIKKHHIGQIAIWHLGIMEPALFEAIELFLE